MRDPYAMLNTHIKTVKGIVSVDDGTMKIMNVDIRFTSDTHGETLSLTVGSAQVAVRYSEIEKLVEETRKDRGDTA